MFQFEIFALVDNISDADSDTSALLPDGREDDANFASGSTSTMCHLAFHRLYLLSSHIMPYCAISFDMVL